MNARRMIPGLCALMLLALLGCGAFLWIFLL